ncbi:uncharacterized protein KY384_005758 [Bacidia gigantensis]|uniref:uncharacterized protein n=1 Tax=Bacidia gigantensis TaxID=2732470 RepID=UPI001D048D67|nr:uncharacterized protein KY384_005758 [Bacidia gigantensis]KAG8529123.1 hypothetical protein KY384_005758 [Bacidia gigantensis]
MHHLNRQTDCGASMYTDASVKDGLKARLPPNLHGEVDSMDFHGITDVRDDMDVLKADPFVPPKLKENAYGFVFDIKTGLMTPVQG